MRGWVHKLVRYWGLVSAKIWLFCYQTYSIPFTRNSKSYTIGPANLIHLSHCVFLLQPSMRTDIHKQWKATAQCIRTLVCCHFLHAFVFALCAWKACRFPWTQMCRCVWVWALAWWRWVLPAAGTGGSDWLIHQWGEVNNCVPSLPPLLTTVINKCRSSSLLLQQFMDAPSNEPGGKRLP